MGNKLIMQGDGNLVMYNRSGKAIWCTNTSNGGRAPDEFWRVGQTPPASRMDKGETLWQGNAIDACGYFFAIQDDGNLVVYKDGGDPIWASDTNGQHEDNPDKRLVMQDDGNLVFYAGDEVIWASDTNDKGGTYVKMQDDGNFVMYNGDDQPVWCTR